MKWNIKYQGKTKTNSDKKWSQVTCYINFNITDEFKELTEREFQDHQGFDIEQIKSNPGDRGLLTEPHNIARAILLYKYFRKNGFYFENNMWDIHHIK